MSYEISAQNIKCGGCASTIIENLNKLDAVSDCQVDVETGVVSVDADDSSREEVAQLLAKLGYPENS